MKMSSAAARAYEAKLQELLGERGKGGDNAAVRWRDLADFKAEMRRMAAQVAAVTPGPGGGTDPGGGTGGGDGTGGGGITQEELDALIASITAAEAEAARAAAAANNAQAAADAAVQHADEQVQQARSDLAVDYQAALDAAGEAGTARDEAVTASEAASGSASAAASRASEAASSATAAGESAAAALLEKVAAETAKGAAEVARSDAVVAKENAETAAAGAVSSFNMAARMASQGLSVITDTLLGGPAWTRWPAGGNAFQRVPNEQYPQGHTWDFTTIAGQEDGIVLLAATPAVWPGQMNALAYAVEVEYSLISGSLAGANVALDWNTTTSEFRAQMAFTQMVSGTSLFGRTTLARGVFKRPAGFTGTFTNHDLIISIGPSKRIKFHRISIRVATEEELGRGQVMAEVQAHLTQNYLTRVNTEQAIASAEERLSASIGTVNASASRSATALAQLNGASAIVTQEVIAGQQRAVIRQAAWDGNGNVAPGSAITFDARDIILHGSVMMDQLAVGNGKNLLVNAAFWDNLNHWTSWGQYPYSAYVDFPGDAAWLSRDQPVLVIAQTGGSNSGVADVYSQPMANANGDRGVGVPVIEGRYYIASAKIHPYLCNGQVLLTFLNGQGQEIAVAESVPVPSAARDTSIPQLFPLAFVKALAPAGARYARIHFRKHTAGWGQVSYLFGAFPQIEETHAEAKEPSPWSSGAISLMTGDRFFSETILARHISAETMRALNGRFKSLAAANVQIDYGEIRAAHIEDLTIGPEKIRVNGLTTLRSVNVPTTAVAPFSTGETVAATLSFNAYEAGTKLLISLEGTATSGGGTGATPSDYRCDVRLYLNGSRIGSASVSANGGGASGYTPAGGPIDMNRVRLAAAGTNTIQVRVSNAGQLNASSLWVQEFNR